MSAPRGASRALRASMRQLSTQAPTAQRRTFVAAASAARAGVKAAPKAAVTPFQQTRGLKTVDFAGVKEDVYERADWPKEKLLVSSAFFHSHNLSLTVDIGIL